MKNYFGVALFILLILLLFVNTAKGQFFQTGQDPSQIRWRQINTDNFQIIYPEEFDKEAQRLTFVLTKVYEYGTKTMNFNPRKISAVLHTRTVNSNGLVAWAPKRIELFTTPHQQIYAQDWLEELGLHEFRHLVQLDKIQSELPFILKLLLGEQATAIVTGTYLPLWFLEGDAVVTETALSPAGRGRLASFSMEYRAQLTEKRRYSFDKAYLGSYKDFVPDHYKLGYWLVGKSREKYGSQLWSEVLDKVGNQPLSITPVNSVLKKETNLNNKNLYNQIFNDLSNDWKQNINQTGINDPSVVSPYRKNYTNYLYPEFYKDSFIIAYRTSIDDLSRFVLISPDKSEKILYTPGSIFDESVDIKNQFIIWSENRADIRWTHADRPVIIAYNIETKKKHEINYKNKLFSPALSPDLKSFAAVEVDPENNYYLSVFDLNSGKLKQRFRTDDNQYFFTPCWDEKGEKLYFVSLSSKGKYIASYNLQTKEFKSLTSKTFANLKNPVFANHQLIFSSDFSGTDNMYSVDTESLQITMIYKANFGVDYPSESNSNNQIVFSNYSSYGYQLSLLGLSEKANLKEMTDISLQANKLADHLAAQEKGLPNFANNDSIKYTSKKYSKVGHLFNIHSWAPGYIDVNNYDIRPGVSIFSQNKLGTAVTQIGYDYNVADHTGKYKLAFNYSGLFPEFDTELSYGNGTSQYYKMINNDTIVQRFTWNEVNADLDIRLPLNLSKGKYSSVFYPEIKYTFNQFLPNLSPLHDTIYSGIYHAMTYRLYYYHLLHQSVQSLMPKWGQQFDLIYRHTPFAGNNLGNIAGIQSVLYFPGLAKNDGIKIYQGYQERRFTQIYNFSDFIRYPRGFQSFQNNKMYSASVDYKFPILYPDLSVGKLAFIKRLKSSLFYDYALLSVPAIDSKRIIYLNYREIDMKSFGLELTSDLHVMRFFAPIEMGLRTIYRPDFHDFQFNFLFSINFNGF